MCTRMGNGKGGRISNGASRERTMGTAVGSAMGLAASMTRERWRRDYRLILCKLLRHSAGEL